MTRVEKSEMLATHSHLKVITFLSSRNPEVFLNAKSSQCSILSAKCCFLPQFRSIYRKNILIIYMDDESKSGSNLCFKGISEYGPLI